MASELGNRQAIPPIENPKASLARRLLISRSAIRNLTAANLICVFVILVAAAAR